MSPLVENIQNRQASHLLLPTLMKPLRLASTLVGLAAVAACSLQAPAPQPRRPEVEACDRSCKTLGGEEGFRCLDHCSTAGIPKPTLTKPST